MILIITHKQDYTADFLINKLNALKIPYYRFNTDDKECIEMALVNVNSKFGISINNIAAFDSIWFRRVKTPDYNGLSIEESQVMHEQTYSFYSNLWETIEGLWFSRPSCIYRAENKLLQLKEALKIGFTLPPSLVSSDKNEIIKFYYDHNENIIIKPITSARFKDKIVYTTLLNKDTVNSLDKFILAPSIYQSNIAKELELRVTVVGDKVFCASVDSQSNSNTSIDWRRERQPFKPYLLPSDVSFNCIRLVKKLGLLFGAIDLILDSTGNYIFLEINPNGQWAWIEMDTELPISSAIIETLNVKK